MKLSKAQNGYNFSDTPQSIILVKLQNVKISEESFIRFGDKNAITKGLRALYLTKKNGYPLDKFAVNYLQFLDEYDEKEKIELTIETMIQYDSKKKIDDLFKTLKPEKFVKAVNKDVDIKAAKPCLVKASLQHMNRRELRAELNQLKKSPSAYFGPLLDVNECKVDLFTVNEKQQIELANQMLAQLDREEKQKPAKPKISLGKQKPVNLGYGETLKPQSGYSNLKTQSDKNMDNPKWVKSQNETFNKKMDELFTYIEKNGYPKKETENPYEYQMYSRLNHLATRPDLLALISENRKKVIAERPSNKTKVIKSQSKQNPIMAKAKKKTAGKKVNPMKPRKITPTRVKSISQKENQNRIKVISKLATTIQDEAGFRTVTKKVHIMNRSTAVKKAANKLKK